MLEIYKDSNGLHKDLLSMNPVSIEQRLALIEAIQIKFPNLNNISSIQNEMNNLNAYKSKKLQSWMGKFDLSKDISHENLEEFSSDFFLILKGPPLSLLDYFSRNKTRAMNESMFQVLQEDMLIRGLRGSLARIPAEKNAAEMDKALHYIKKIMKYKAWRFMIHPYDLPWIDTVRIPDELLETIFMDGLDAHESELIIELKKQNAVDHYERFREVFRPVAFGIGFYYYYQKYQQIFEGKQEKDLENAKKTFIEEFKKLSDSINAKKGLK